MNIQVSLYNRTLVEMKQNVTINITSIVLHALTGF